MIQRDLRIEKEKHDPDPVRLAELSERLGNLYGLRGRYADAESAFRAGLDVLQRLLAHTDVRVAMALTNLAFTLDASGREISAAGYAEQAWRILDGRSGASPAAMIGTLSVLGRVYSKTNRDQLAETYLKMALDKAESSYGPNHPAVAYVLMNFAGAMRRSHQNKVARAMDKQAQAILIQHNQTNFFPYTVDLQSLVPKKQ